MINKMIQTKLGFGLSEKFFQQFPARENSNVIRKGQEFSTLIRVLSHLM